MVKRRNSGRPTIHDVARHAGVSSITVSRALRTPTRVSEELRERVILAVKALNYVPDAKARALASGQTNVIGVLIPSLSNIVFGDTLRAMHDAVAGTDYQIQIGNTRYSTEEEDRLISLFMGQRPAALIVTGIDQSESSRRLLAGSGMPVVQIMDISSDPIDMIVGFSHHNAAESAVEHLLANGYTRIGFLGARMDPRIRRRLVGFRRALCQHDLYSPLREITTEENSSVGIGRVLFRKLLKAAPDTDAIFCGNDDLALGTLFECTAQRIDVPNQMGIIGFNDFEMMAAAEPSLSSIRTKRYEMGLRAVEMVLERLENGPAKRENILDLGFELVARDSTKRSQLESSATVRKNRAAVQAEPDR